MKKLFIFLVLLNFSFLKAQNHHSKEIETIVENMFEHVFSKLDESSVNKYLTNDFVLFEEGEIFNLDSIQSMVKELKNRFETESKNGNLLERKNHFEFFNSKIDGNTAWVYYRNTADFFLNGNSIMKIEWLENAVLERQANEWKIRFLHSTKIKN